MKKWQIENSVTSELSEILLRVLLFPSFQFYPTAKIENSDLKTLEKNFRDFRVFRGFGLFDQARNYRRFEIASLFTSRFKMKCVTSFFKLIFNGSIRLLFLYFTIAFIVESLILSKEIVIWISYNVQILYYVWKKII